MKKITGFLFFAAVLAVFFVSCSKDNASGPVSAGRVKLTATPTFTPDVNFSVYIHQEQTPVDGVNLTMYCAAEGVTLYAATGAEGTGDFEIHSGGQWNLVVDPFNGFKHQYFAVEPLSNTCFAVNYGIPSLDLELVSGSENIPISFNTIIYRVIYHTKFEREETIKMLVPDSIVLAYSAPLTVSNEGDEITCTLNIPKSFEEYGDDKVHLSIKAGCEFDTGNNTQSNERVLAKNWRFNVTANYLYMSVYDYADNYKTSYYAGIRNIDTSLSYNIPFTGTMKYEAVGGINEGDAGMTGIANPGNCMPSFTSLGCFSALLKIKTDKGHEYAWSHNSNNGRLTVRFYDDGYLDVRRTFSTNNGWSITCAHWCCTSRDISRASSSCGNNLQMPCGSCSLWDHFEVADVCRVRSERVNITE